MAYGGGARSKFTKRLEAGKPMFNKLTTRQRILRGKAKMYDWHIKFWRQHQFNNRVNGPDEWWWGR